MGWEENRKKKRGQQIDLDRPIVDFVVVGFIKAVVVRIPSCNKIICLHDDSCHS